MCADVDSRWTHSTVYFDVLLREPGAEVGDFGHAPLNELLSAST